MIKDLEKSMGLVPASEKELKELEQLTPLHFIANIVSTSLQRERGGEETVCEWNELKEESQIEAVKIAEGMFKHWKDDQLFLGRTRGRKPKVDIEVVEPKILL